MLCGLLFSPAHDLILLKSVLHYLASFGDRAYECSGAQRLKTCRWHGFCEIQRLHAWRAIWHQAQIFNVHSSWSSGQPCLRICHQQAIIILSLTGDRRGLPWDKLPDFWDCTDDDSLSHSLCTCFNEDSSPQTALISLPNALQGCLNLSSPRLAAGQHADLPVSEDHLSLLSQSSYWSQP